MINYKKPNTHIIIKNKATNEIMAKGLLIAYKDKPELLVSFDFKYFFRTSENSLYKIELTTDNDIICFDKEKYKDKIYPYKGLDKRNSTCEYIFREFDINELDPEIAPLVYALNNSGYKTTGSCCGHGIKIAWIHVLFENMIQLQLLLGILNKEKFKYNFILCTSTDIENLNSQNVALSLQTTKKGEAAYKDILELSKYIEKKHIIF